MQFTMLRIFCLLLTVGLLFPLRGYAGAYDDTLLRKYLLIEHGSSSRTGFLTSAERRKLYEGVDHHKVAGIEALKKYDPDGTLGLCYGRAVAVHLMALRMGLAPTAIRKLFIVGRLTYAEDKEWRFHVATIVRGDDSLWYAIDPTLGLPLATVPDWLAEVRHRWSGGRPLTLYLTPPSAIIPDISHYPDKKGGTESGNYILDLTFNPSAKVGFPLRKRMGIFCHLPTSKNLRRYFMQAGNKEGLRFDFEKAVVRGKVYSFNGYFSDLLDSLLQTMPSAGR
jgi:hypothetical protein